MLGNKTENAFSPLPASTKADLTVCLSACHYKTALFRLQDYRNFLRPDN
jgi:hypothetical protein